MNENDEYIKTLEDWLDDRKKDLHYSQVQFDKLIIMLSSGALVLTIGFVRDIVVITEKTDTSLLKNCWYIFAAALISNLIAQVCSFGANNIEIQRTTIEIDLLKENQNTTSAIVLAPWKVGQNYS